MNRTFIPTTGAATVHTHAESDVTSLTADLALKAAKASNLSDLASASTARTNLGLGNVDNTSDANKPVSTATQTALDAVLAPFPNFASGAYFFVNSPNGNGTSSTLGVGTLRVFPWIVRRAVSIARLGAEVTTVGDAGSKFRIVIYGDSGSGLPGSLVVDAGQIAGDSATVQELTVSTALSPGLYWVGGAVQTVTTTQPTLRTASGNWVPPMLLHQGTSIPSSNATSQGWSGTGVTGAAPGTFPGGGSGPGTVPRIFARVA